MRKFAKILKRVGLVLLSIILILVIGIIIYLNYPAVFSRQRIGEIDVYGMPVSEITIPDSVSVVGLGEAAHGNVEFQQLKLTLFQKLVEKYNYKAFGLEVDFGEGIVVNDYIQGGEGTALDVLCQTSNPIYHTEQMAELVDWMRNYNKAAKEADKLRFYGFDMQALPKSATYLVNYLKQLDTSSIEERMAHLDTLTLEDYYVEDEEIAGFVETVSSINEYLLSQKQIDWNQEYEYALHAANSLLQTLNGYGTEEGYMDYRDSCMADNVGWIMENEKQYGNEKLMVAAHNGHITKSWSDGSPTFGHNLNDMFGDNYFAIGTDFFTADININKSSMFSSEYIRSNHHFCSADPLAYQAKYFDGNMYYLDFADIPKENTKLYEQIHSETHMANIGEGYMWIGICSQIKYIARHRYQQICMIL